MDYFYLVMLAKVLCFLMLKKFGLNGFSVDGQKVQENIKRFEKNVGLIVG